MTFVALIHFESYLMKATYLLTEFIDIEILKLRILFRCVLCSQRNLKVIIKVATPDWFQDATLKV